MNITPGLNDPQSKRILKQMRDEGGFRSDADLIRAALRILRTLQEQALAGYSDLIVQNPENGEQQLVIGLSDVLGQHHGNRQKS